MPSMKFSEGPALLYGSELLGNIQALLSLNHSGYFSITFMSRSSLFFYLYDTENVFNKYCIAEKHEEETDLCACGEVTRGEMAK